MTGKEPPKPWSLAAADIAAWAARQSHTAATQANAAA